MKTTVCSLCFRVPTIDGTLTFTSTDVGRKLFEMAWARTRQTGIAGKSFAEQWAAIGTPIQPIPDEEMKLEMLVGTRDVQFINRPSLTVPHGSTAKETQLCASVPLRFDPLFVGYHNPRS